jgi:hypothetical protein
MWFILKEKSFAFMHGTTVAISGITETKIGNTGEKL